MSDKALDFQNNLLNHCRREGLSLSVYLLKGVRLQGVISGFDPFVLTLKRDGEEQLVYKHGVATISMRLPADALDLSAPAGGEGLQQNFLDKAVGADVVAFLVNGVRLGGRLVAHDRFTLLLEGPNATTQLVYKHALSSVSGGER